MPVSQSKKISHPALARWASSPCQATACAGKGIDLLWFLKLLWSNSWEDWQAHFPGISIRYLLTLAQGQRNSNIKCQSLSVLVSLGRISLFLLGTNALHLREAKFNGVSITWEKGRQDICHYCCLKKTLQTVDAFTAWLWGKSGSLAWQKSERKAVLKGNPHRKAGRHMHAWLTPPFQGFLSSLKQSVSPHGSLVSIWFLLEKFPQHQMVAGIIWHFGWSEKWGKTQRGSTDSPLRSPVHCI